MPGLRVKVAAVTQLGIEFAFQHVKHVAAVAPMIGQIAGRVLDHPNPQLANIERAPERLAGFTRMNRDTNLAPVGDGEGQCWYLHWGKSRVYGSR
jgi:hypothetical protein